MLYQSLAVLSILLSQAMAIPTAAETDSPIPGYEIADINWEVEVFPGRLMNLTGTIGEVRRQATQLNPRWDLEDIETLADESREDASESLDKRGPNWTNIVCGPGPNNFAWADLSIIRSMIPKIRPWRGTPSMLPLKCGAITCHDGNKIMLCNDNTGELRLRAFLDIADGAQRIADSCALTGAVAGQQFAYGGWNVIVTSGSFGLPCRK